MKHEEGSEVQRKNLEAAVRLAQLSIDNTLKIMSLMAELAQRLLHDGAAGEVIHAGSDDSPEAIQARTQRAQRTMRLMTDGAQKVAAVGADARLQFSRLLTEQLASGSHELMDAFQSFFKVLPPQNAETVEMIELAAARGHGAFEQIAAAVAAAAGSSPEAARRTRPKHRRSALPANLPPRPPIEPRAY